MNLQAEENEERYWYTWTDKEGRYEFPLVQPGNYLLGFNLRWAPDKDSLTLPPALSRRQLPVSVEVNGATSLSDSTKTDGSFRARLHTRIESFRITPVEVLVDKKLSR